MLAFSLGIFCFPLWLVWPYFNLIMSAMTLFLSMFPHSQVLGQHKFCRVQGELFNLVYLITLQPTFLNTQVTLHSLCVSVHMSQYWPTLNTVLPYRCPSTAPPWTQCFRTRVPVPAPPLNTVVPYTCSSTAPPWTQHFCTRVPVLPHPEHSTSVAQM